MTTAGVDVQPGRTFPPREFGPITMTDIVRYQGASGDLNPMHHDDAMAQAAGYPASFSVGMLGAGYLATYCTDLFGTRTVRRFRTRFRKVVYRGEVLTARAVVRGIRGSGDGVCVELGLELVDSTGAVVVDGSAEFLAE